MALTKPCNRCGETKPMDAFARCSSRSDGRQKRCRECGNAYDRERTKRLNAQGLTQRGKVRVGKYRTGPEDRPFRYGEMQRRWAARAGDVWFADFAFGFSPRPANETRLSHP